MKRVTKIISVFILLTFFLHFQLILPAQRWMEGLGRGVVAVRTNTSQVFIGWRLFGTEVETTTFNIYRNGIKINNTPVDATNYTDNTSINGNYIVKSIVNGSEDPNNVQVPVWQQQYLQVPVQVPPGGITPDAVAYTYSANDASVGDLDGDGEYEIVLKWDPSNSKDNSQSGYTGNVYLDAYKLNGTRMWRIDLGKNIRAGAHYTQFLVYDFDSDGKAEIACKTADGTIDGKGTVIGNATADYRNSNGYILSGPEFLTVFKGATGEVLDTEDYIPARGTVSSWGDNYGNRVDRFLAAVAYLDGQKPSMIFARGYYTRLVRAAWDFANGQLQLRWVFDSNTSGNSSYAGMGNHQMTVGDANGDGKDEIYNGSSAVNYDGTGFFVNGLGHGDALHLTDMNPDRPGLEIWQCYEEQTKYVDKGLRMLDASSGQTLWGVNTTGDVGRALAGDIDPRYKGYECWGTNTLYNCKGDSIGPSRPSINHAVWWDGDLLREILDGDVLDKWNYVSNNSSRLLTLYQTTMGSGVSNNSTKKNPCLTADIFGDWREEIILRSSDNNYLNIYTTINPTTYKYYTLMHDPQYRMAVAWQNAAYNQPPHPGFYLGDGMQAPLRPNIRLTNTQVITSVGSLALEGITFKAFPNPSSSDFKLTLGTTSLFRYEVFDASGRKLLFGEANREVTFGANLYPGVYFVRVKVKNNSTTLKIIKQ